MRTSLLLFFILISSSSFALDSMSIEKGDRLRFLYACKVKDQLGRLSLMMEPGQEVTVKSFYKSIASPPGFLPAIEVYVIKFRHEFVNRWGSVKKWVFERRSNDGHFYCLEKVNQ